MTSSLKISLKNLYTVIEIYSIGLPVGALMQFSIWYLLLIRLIVSKNLVSLWFFFFSLLPLDIKRWLYLFFVGWFITRKKNMSKFYTRKHCDYEIRSCLLLKTTEERQKIDHNFITICCKICTDVNLFIMQ